VDQRLRALQAAVSRAEVRIDTVGASDKAIGQLAHGAETLSKHFHELSAQSDELTKKQSSLMALRDRLTEVEELSKRTTSQLASLNQNRSDLGARADIVDLPYKPRRRGPIA
jgi:CII-binding regulator of phage lambda lysogenization HflD